MPSLQTLEYSVTQAPITSDVTFDLQNIDVDATAKQINNSDVAFDLQNIDVDGTLLQLDVEAVEVLAKLDLSLTAQFEVASPGGFFPINHGPINSAYNRIR